MIWFLIVLVIIVALGFGAFIIFLIVKFFKWLFSTPKSTPVVNANPNIDKITNSVEFKQFSSNRIEYWNKIIKEQKSAGVFDETKRIYETGEYKGIKYSIIHDTGGPIDNEDPADLLIQMIIFSQL
ncbi:MAG: hypothetical protein M1409_07850 [Actinobacteria bacterium]|nr:hypothetical protein [Actinomycetota bacterium]